MFMKPLKALAKQAPAPVQSCLRQLHAALAKQKDAFGDYEGSARRDDMFLSEALQQTAPSSQEASERRKAIAEVLRGTDFNTKVSSADWLLVEGNYEGAIALYERIAIDHPEKIGFCLRCIGTAHYYLRDYETAIAFFQKALSRGEDIELIAGDISEARDAMIPRGPEHRAAA